jgi:hypothetical protein
MWQKKKWLLFRLVSRMHLSRRGDKLKCIYGKDGIAKNVIRHATPEAEKFAGNAEQRNRKKKKS